MAKVYLVGAGPGDPELITWKGRRVLQAADVVLYDHLASRSLLDLAPPAAERIFVGKRRGQQACSQAGIGDLLIDRARRGLSVVRLKGGDPFIFGRGGEELEQLAEAGVVYEVVPGVTAALGVAAYTGVPLTHRDHTAIVTFVTGHSLEAVDWRGTVDAQTLVVFMGLHNLTSITTRLMSSGRQASTPAMAVEWGTHPRQRTVTGTLETLAERVAAANLQSPVTLIVGSVVNLHDKLAWFEKLPLHGKRIVVTRARAQSGELVSGLKAAGAEVIELPMIEMVTPEDATALRSCLDQLESYDWIVFTSANAVVFSMNQVSDLRRIHARICAIGEATASALRGYRLGVDLVPPDSTGEGVAAAFEQINLEGSRVLFPRAGGAREVVPKALSSRGAVVDSPMVYRNVIPADARGLVREWEEDARPTDWITFTSPSTIDHFLQCTSGAPAPGTRIATIGPTTSEALRLRGIRVDVEAQEPSVASLLKGLLDWHSGDYQR